MLYHNCVGLNLSFLLKWSSPHNLCEHIICIDSEPWVPKELFELRDNKIFKRTNTFEGRVAFCDEYYILRGVSYTVIDYINEGCVTHCNGSFYRGLYCMS